MSSKQKVLLVEDSPSLAAMYQQFLKNEPVILSTVDSGRDALAHIEREAPHLVLLDLNLPDISGQDVLQWLKDRDLPTAVVVITAHSSVDVAVEVMRAGAIDFLEKPFDAARLKTTVNNVLEKIRLNSIVADLKSTLERDQYEGFVGASLPMQKVYNIIDAAAPSSATVFITGESGTGKEVCAEAIHKKSPLKNKPFIALNCGAIPKDLMESEIFGHVKGAFTGASSERQGAASAADGGTLFLDEIGEMDFELQTKLLRFIQTGIIKKVGSNKEEQVNVRFICATNRDPLEEVAAGRFREDLYYRLNVIPIHLPPLRERDDDIYQLALFFLKKYAQEDNKNFSKLSKEVEQIFRTYSWPGNIRQLQNIVRNIVVLHNSDTVEQTHLPAPLNQLDVKRHQLTSSAESSTPLASESRDENPNPPIVRPLALIEREAIENAIEHCGGNIPKAAALLDVSPSTIYRKKQSWA